FSYRFIVCNFRANCYPHLSIQPHRPGDLQCLLYSLSGIGQAASKQRILIKTRLQVNSQIIGTATDQHVGIKPICVEFYLESGIANQGYDFRKGGMKSGFSAAEYNTFNSTFSLIKIPGDFNQRYLRKPVQNNFRILAIGAAKIAC